MTGADCFVRQCIPTTATQGETAGLAVDRGRQFDDTHTTRKRHCPCRRIDAGLYEQSARSQIVFA